MNGLELMPPFITPCCVKPSSLTWSQNCVLSSEDFSIESGLFLKSLYPQIWTMTDQDKVRRLLIIRPRRRTRGPSLEVTFESEWFSITVLMVQLLGRCHFITLQTVLWWTPSLYRFFFFPRHKAGLSLSRPLIAVQYSRSRDIQYNLYTTYKITLRIPRPTSCSSASMAKISFPHCYFHVEGLTLLLLWRLKESDVAILCCTELLNIYGVTMYRCAGL